MLKFIPYMSQTGKIITPPFYKHNTFKIYFHLAFSTVVSAECGARAHSNNTECAKYSRHSKMNDESFVEVNAYQKARVSTETVQAVDNILSFSDLLVLITGRKILYICLYMCFSICIVEY